jgi:VanZ family protein
VLLASSASFSASNTSRVIRPLLLWLFPEITEASLASAHFLARKAAHFTEYAVLALLAARAFLTSSDARLKSRWRLAAFALVASVALVDEYHQSFLPSRTGTIYDSLLDMAGGAAALACVGIWRARRGGAKTAGRGARAEF